MRLGFLFGFVLIMWTLIILGGFILLKIVAPIELEAGPIASSVLKAGIALSMVAGWIWILISLKNAYIGKRLTVKN